jgi:hypothetical protein
MLCNYQALLLLADKNTEKGMDQAVQALAKIAISLDPEVAFPGHKVGTIFIGKLYKFGRVQ